MSVGNEENLLSRWSRRKQQSEEQSRLEDQLITAGSAGVAEKETHSALTGCVDESSQAELEPKVLTDADMPALESLSEDPDFSMFMSSEVSDKLRNLALRKLFQAPSFNIQDGLDDYAEDYTSFEKLGDIVTCDMTHQIEMQARKKLEQEAENLIQQDKSPDQLEVDTTGETESAELMQAQDGESFDTNLPETTQKTDTVHE